MKKETRGKKIKKTRKIVEVTPIKITKKGDIKIENSGFYDVEEHLKPSAKQNIKAKRGKHAKRN